MGVDDDRPAPAGTGKFNLACFSGELVHPLLGAVKYVGAGCRGQKHEKNDNGHHDQDDFHYRVARFGDWRWRRTAAGTGLESAPGATAPCRGAQASAK